MFFTDSTFTIYHHNLAFKSKPFDVDCCQRKRYQTKRDRNLVKGLGQKFLTRVRSDIYGLDLGLENFP